MATGKLYKRNNKWYVDIHTGKKADGKYERIQRKASGRTKAEAQAELDEQLYSLRRTGKSGAATNNAYPLQSVVDEWCRHMRRQKHSEKLVNGYCIQAKRMAEYLGVDMVSEIKLEIIESALSKIADDFSTNTANKCLHKMRSALGYALDRHVIASNPMAKARQLRVIRKKFRRELAKYEAETLLSTAPEPWRTIWHFFLATGVRSGEFLHILPDDIDLSRKHVRVIERENFKPKTNSSIRTIPLGDGIVLALENLKNVGMSLHNPQGTPLRPEYLLDTFRKHIEVALRIAARERMKAKLPLPRNVTYDANSDEFQIDTNSLDVHSLRYTYITELIAAGVDIKTVQRLAGHKSIETTLAIYAQVKSENASDAANQLPW